MEQNWVSEYQEKLNEICESAHVQAYAIYDSLQDLPDKDILMALNELIPAIAEKNAAVGSLCAVEFYEKDHPFFKAAVTNTGVEKWLADGMGRVAKLLLAGDKENAREALASTIASLPRGSANATMLTNGFLRKAEEQ